MREIPPEEQIPGDELTVYKAVALARLVRPEANIPSTTALATINKVDGRELGLQRGANIVMPNLTPPEYREKYEIYPDKACVTRRRRCAAAACRARGVHRPGRSGRGLGDGGTSSTKARPNGCRPLPRFIHRGRTAGSCALGPASIDLRRRSAPRNAQGQGPERLLHL